ncbi:MAG: hypothetical protein U0350_01295 [Caldilineaceae bacterium]
MPRLFLETTIQIQRLIYGNEERQRINQILQPYEVVTSTYVWMEVQRTIGQDYQYLIDLLLGKQPTTFAQLLRLLGEGEQLFSLRSLKRLLHIVTRLLDEFKTTTLNPIAVTYWLKEEQQWLLHHEFFAGIHQILDATHCDLVRPQDKVATEGRISCHRITARCNLSDLLKQHGPSIQQLSGKRDVLSALEAKTQRAIEAVQNNFDLAKGEQNCWALGDLIIVLECPIDALLWTTNVRHFEPLCRALDRQLFELPA